MKTNDGGPAFPVMHSIDGNWNREPFKEYMGMTLRDWFAGQALGALIGQLSNTEQAEEEMVRSGFCQGEFDKLVAKCAYDYADAMLAARETKKED